jgi:Fe-S-cluster containining protein
MKINYSNEYWFLELPSTKKEWDTLLIICQKLGISFLSENYDKDYECLISSKDTKDLCRSYNRRNKACGRHKVSFYEMINILTTPEKSAQQLQIEQLEYTIAQAMVEVNALKTGVKL